MSKKPLPAEVIKKAQKKAKDECLELAFLALLKAHGLPIPERQAKVIQGRKWAWDFAYRENKILIEMNGQIWKPGGHNTGSGLLRDYEKMNAAQLSDWRCFTFTKEHLDSGYAIQTIREALFRFPPF